MSHNNKNVTARTPEPAPVAVRRTVAAVDHLPSYKLIALDGKFQINPYYFVKQCLRYDVGRSALFVLRERSMIEDFSLALQSQARFLCSLCVDHVSNPPPFLQVTSKRPSLSR